MTDDFFATAADDTDLLTVTETAEICRRAARDVHGWISNGVIPAVRVRGLWRIRRTDLEAFLADIQARRPAAVVFPPPAAARIARATVPELAAEAKRGLLDAIRDRRGTVVGYLPGPLRDWRLGYLPSPAGTLCERGRQ